MPLVFLPALFWEAKIRQKSDVSLNTDLQALQGVFKGALSGLGPFVILKTKWNGILEHYSPIGDICK
jgi:hypothetical protein